MAGVLQNINSCAINKHCANRQFSASNPPLLLAAKRYGQVIWTRQGKSYLCELTITK
jgi:hypothetical protein